MPMTVPNAPYVSDVCFSWWVTSPAPTVISAVKTTAAHDRAG